MVILPRHFREDDEIFYEEDYEVDESQLRLWEEGYDYDELDDEDHDEFYDDEDDFEVLGGRQAGWGAYGKNGKE